MLGTDPLNPQNSYCLSCEDGLSVFDQRHRFVTSIVYDLPDLAARILRIAHLGKSSACGKSLLSSRSDRASHSG
jgi:hypothetical protein